MHLSVNFRLFKAALFITPDLGTEQRKWLSVIHCLKREPFVEKVDLKLSIALFVILSGISRAKGKILMLNKLDPD